MTQEQSEKHNKKLLWVWIALLTLIVVIATEDACDLRRNNPELENNAYLLSCGSEQTN